jgi:hypothetical protein
VHLSNPITATGQHNLKVVQDYVKVEIVDMFLLKGFVRECVVKASSATGGSGGSGGGGGGGGGGVLKGVLVRIGLEVDISVMGMKVWEKLELEKVIDLGEAQGMCYLAFYS